MTNRTWLITGVSSGFGRLLAEQLLERGDRVAGTVRDPAAVEDLKIRYGDRLWTAVLDMTDAPAIQGVVDRAFADLGSIDVVISNAGYGLFGAAEELTGEQVDHQIATNLVGPIHLVRAALPHLRARGGGRILQVSSYGGQATSPGGSLYNASKWGVEGFMEATAKDVAPFGIGVTIVEPGSARTGFRTGSSRLATPLAAYDDSPAKMVRGIRDPSLPSKGDPAKMAAAMIDSVDRHPAPLRIALGSDSYAYVRQALGERLADIEAQRDLAFSTDLPAGG
ncbi:short-chain dehydrogenase [Streptomyces sp. 150FB]|uniref:SDR family oxidoreductase n=1 Tax=Streptomyces sp. 150FB TaxID=1576605 RepID=UPI0005895A93|nr:SDR family oxidoreductase [Streptomyces sp. 150FB]KIF78179.1 short-chain dehydrogenase [Streptomyces sp. 150FB]